MQLKLIKIGARVVRHARAITFQLAEVAVTGPMVRARAPQRLGLSPTGARKHDADRPEANNALTFKLDHPMGGTPDHL